MVNVARIVAIETRNNIQGCLNAKAIKLINASDSEKLEFWNSLTTDQKKRVKSHIETYQAIADKKKYLK